MPLTIDEQKAEELLDELEALQSYLEERIGSLDEDCPAATALQRILGECEHEIFAVYDQ